MFQIIGAMAEFERALIAEHVCAGLAVARAEGKRLGRPRRDGVDAAKTTALRAQGWPGPRPGVSQGLELQPFGRPARGARKAPWPPLL